MLDTIVQLLDIVNRIQYRFDMAKQQNVTRWSAVSAGHIMMGATLQDGPISMGVFGRQLRNERLYECLSLDKVARHFRCGVTRQAILKIEKKTVVSPAVAADFRRAIRAAIKCKNLKLGVRR